MRRLFFIFCSFLCVFSSFAQETFHKAFNYKEYNLQLKKHIPLSDGGYLLFSNTADIAFLLRTDAQGEEVWGFRIEAGANIYDALEVPGGDIVLTGKITSATTHETDDMLVLCINGAGQLKWSRSYFAGDQEAGRLLAVHNNQLYVAGQTESYTAMPSRIFLMRLDLNGNILSESGIFMEDHEHLNGILIKSSQVYIVGALRYTNTDPTIFMADLDGSFTKWYSFPLPGSNTANSIAATPEGVVISGDNSGQGAPQQILIHFDPGDVLPAYANLVHLFGDTAMINSSIIATDSFYYVSGILSPAGAHDCGILMKLDSEFKPVYTKKFYDKAGNGGFYSLSATADGSIAGAGYLNMGSHFNRMLFYKTGDSDDQACANNVRVFTAIENSIAITKHQINLAHKKLSSSAISPVIYATTFSDTLICGKYTPGFTVSDTLFCSGRCITFPWVSPGGSEYAWELTGGNPSSFKGKNPGSVCYAQPGKFLISLRTRIGAKWDTVSRYIQVLKTPHANAGNDTLLCGNVAVRLHASGGFSYAWLPDPALNDLKVPDPVINPLKNTTFHVKVSDSSGACSSFDSVNVRVLYPPDNNVGFDTSICPFESLTLDARNPGFSYTWSNGDTHQKITPSAAGQYTVKISNACFASEVPFRVHYKDCRSTWFIPTAFTPDGDGLNDIFTAKGEYIHVVKIKIFNRWGQKLFEEEGKHVSWDGTFNGKKCEGGVYIYLMEIRGADGQGFYPTGTIQLLE
jgi:gliding motility-associated-like protein